jgi:hypothetical protein
MKYILALFALMAMIGFATAMVAPTTSGTVGLLAMPLTDHVPSTQVTTTTAVGFSGLLTTPLNVGVPTTQDTPTTRGNYNLN